MLTIIAIINKNMCCKAYTLLSIVYKLFIVINVIIVLIGFSIKPHVSFWGPLPITGTDCGGAICSTAYYHTYFGLTQEYCSMINDPCVQMVNITAPINDSNMNCDIHDGIIIGLFSSLLGSSLIIFISSIFKVYMTKTNKVGYFIMIINTIICLMFVAATATTIIFFPGVFSFEGKSNGIITINTNAYYQIYKFYSIHEFISLYCKITHSILSHKFDTVDIIVARMEPCYSHVNYVMIIYFVLLFIIAMIEIIFMIYNSCRSHDEMIDSTSNSFTIEESSTV